MHQQIPSGALERPLFVEPAVPAAVTYTMIREESAKVNDKRTFFSGAEQRRRAEASAHITEMYPLDPTNEPKIDPMHNIVVSERIQVARELKEAAERGDTKRIIDADVSDLYTMARAVHFYGDAISDKFGINPDRVTIGRHELEGVARRKTTPYSARRAELLAMSQDDINRLSDENAVTPHGQQVEGKDNTDTREVNNTTTAWEELKSDQPLLQTEVIDDASFVITALALSHMKEHAADEYERHAAEFALDALRTVTAQQDEKVSITEPEILHKAEVTGTLGPWAGQTVVHAIAEHQLLAH